MAQNSVPWFRGYHAAYQHDHQASGVLALEASGAIFGDAVFGNTDRIDTSLRVTVVGDAVFGNTVLVDAVRAA